MRKLSIIFAALLSATLIATPAFADRGGYGGPRGGGYGRGDGGWGGLAIFGALAGVIVASEIVNSQRPAYIQPQPVYTEPYPAQPVYIETEQPARSANSWYYCRSSAMYYPYTKACPEGWLAVPAQPDSSDGLRK